MKTILLVSFLILASCAHSIQKNLSKIEPGMTRADVVDKLGSPVRVNRDLGNHFWVYRYYDDGSKSWARKAVYFKDDVVEKLGDAPARKIVLKNGVPKTKKQLAEEEMGNNKGSFKDAPEIGSETWYKDIRGLEKERIKKEKLKSVPTYKDIN